MTYSRDFLPDLAMLGSEDADTIDDKIRLLARDVYDRLVTLVVDINADPLELKNLFVADRYHWSLGSGKPSVSSTMFADAIAYVGPAPGFKEVSWLMPVPIPAGLKVTTVKARVARAGDAVMTVQLLKTDETGVTGILASDAVSADGIHELNLPVTFDVDVGLSFFLQVYMISGTAAGDFARFYDMEIGSDAQEV